MNQSELHIALIKELRIKRFRIVAPAGDLMSSPNPLTDIELINVWCAALRNARLSGNKGLGSNFSVKQLSNLKNGA